MNSVQPSLARRDAQAIQAQALAVSSAQYVARVDVTEGESLVTVNFPIEFPDRPAFTDGASLRPGSVKTPGEFPIARGLVMEWITVKRCGVVNHFIGAYVACVVDGPPGTLITLDLVFSGPAYAGAR